MQITKEYLEKYLSELEEEHKEYLKMRIEDDGMGYGILNDKGEEASTEEKTAVIMEDDGTTWTPEENTAYEMGMRQAIKNLIAYNF